MHHPPFETFERMAAKGNLIPLYREILADLETPVSALVKLADRENVFLQIGRASCRERVFRTV